MEDGSDDIYSNDVKSETSTRAESPDVTEAEDNNNINTKNEMEDGSDDINSNDVKSETSTRVESPDVLLVSFVIAISSICIYNSPTVSLVIAIISICIYINTTGPVTGFRSMATLKREMASIIAVGNPGVGKSTILNCLAEAVLFKSGVNFGGGLTYQMDAKPDKHGRMFFDTPGLADKIQREAAGQAITKALRKGGEYKILFFLRLESGRVVGEDITTLKLVLDSAPEIGDQYGLVINKVSPGMATKLQENPKNVKDLLTYIFANIEIERTCKEENIVFLPIISAITDRDDTLIPLKDLKTIDGSPFKDYVTQNLSTVKLTQGKANDIPIDAFEKMTEEIETFKKEMRENKKMFEKKQKEMEEEMKRKVQQADEKAEKNKKEMEDKVQQAENASGFWWKTTGGVSVAGIGAAIGTAILPGSGTAIGAITAMGGAAIGTAIGAASGTVFGAIGEFIANN